MTYYLSIPFCSVVFVTPGIHNKEKNQEPGCRREREEPEPGM